MWIWYFLFMLCIRYYHEFRAAAEKNLPSARFELKMDKNCLNYPCSSQLTPTVTLCWATFSVIKLSLCFLSSLSSQRCKACDGPTPKTMCYRHEITTRIAYFNKQEQTLTLTDCAHFPAISPRKYHSSARISQLTARTHMKSSALYYLAFHIGSVASPP